MRWEQRVYWISLAIGSMTLLYAAFGGFLNWDSFWGGSHIAVGLAAAYLWIRSDLWFTTKDKNKSISSAVPVQADCIIVIILLVSIAVIEAYLLEKIGSKVMFIGSLLVFFPITNWTARGLKPLLEKWHERI